MTDGAATTPLSAQSPAAQPCRASTKLFYEWYTIKNFGALWGVERETAHQWLRDGIIPKRLTKWGRHKRPMIHRAAATIIEQLLGKPALQQEKRPMKVAVTTTLRDTKGRDAVQISRYSYCQFWANTIGPGILPRRGRVYPVLTPLSGAELMPHPPRSPFGRWCESRHCGKTVAAPTERGQTPFADITALANWFKSGEPALAAQRAPLSAVSTLEIGPDPVGQSASVKDGLNNGGLNSP